MGGHGEPEIDFEPLEHDVVSTRLRGWNLKHPGNVFYAKLLKQYAEKANMEEAETNPGAQQLNALLHQYAERIVEIVITDCKGRFLKIPDLQTEPDKCFIMNQKQAVHKVMNGLKNKQQALKKAEGQPEGRQKAAKPPGKEKIKKRSSSGNAIGSKKRKLEKSNKPKVIYQAKPGEKMQINPYALELITHVCNHQSSRSNNSILETPISQYTATGCEPDKERMIRLQLRHRFFSAKAVQMPVIEFARRLLEVWGGRLDEKIQPPAPKQKSKEQPFSAATATDDDGSGGKAMEEITVKSESQEQKQPADASQYSAASTKETALSSVQPPGEEETTAPQNRDALSPHINRSSSKDAESHTPQSTFSAPSAASTFVDNVKKSVAAVSKAMMPEKSNDSQSPESKLTAKETEGENGAKKSSEKRKAESKEADDSGDEDYASAKSDWEDQDNSREELADNDSIDGNEDDDNKKNMLVGEDSTVTEESEGNASDDEDEEAGDAAEEEYSDNDGDDDDE
jgi:hypothetical protein